MHLGIRVWSGVPCLFVVLCRGSRDPIERPGLRYSSQSLFRDGGLFHQERNRMSRRESWPATGNPELHQVIRRDTVACTRLPSQEARNILQFELTNQELPARQARLYSHGLQLWQISAVRTQLALRRLRKPWLPFLLTRYLALSIWRTILLLKRRCS